ncbi:hypothetical protein BKI52_08630 [marine bacterium AO1-C]|nr:hypothetical protein BKI52_08630 [marine bacterium AO1-C]
MKYLKRVIQKTIIVMLRFKVLLLLCCLWGVLKVNAQDTLDLSHRRYNKLVNLAEVLSVLEAQLKDGTKISTANKSMALVTQPLSLVYMDCEKDFSSANSTFFKSVDFQKSRFRGQMGMVYNEFFGEVDFSNTSFENNLSIASTKFRKSANFSESNFSGKRNIFSNLTFYEDANFYGAKFKNTVIFNNVNFYGKIDLMHITLPDTLILANLQSDSTRLSIDISRPMKSSMPCKLYLYNMNFDKLVINYEYFDLCFDDKESNPNPLNFRQKSAVFEALIAQQKTYDFYKGQAKAEQDYEDFKEMQRIIQRNKDSRSISMIGIALLLVTLLYLTIRRNNKTKVIQVTPPVQKTPYKSTLKEAPLTSYQPISIPLEEVQALVAESKQQWSDYNIPKDVLDESDEFWQAYEQLLALVKRIKE